MIPATHLYEDDGITHAENCFPCKLKSVTIAPSAMVTRSPEAARALTTDPALDKDREAYKRLRRNGEQPKNVMGSAFIEKHANESFEIDTGRIVDDAKDRRALATEFAGMPPFSTKPIVREDV